MSLYHPIFCTVFLCCLFDRNASSQMLQRLADLKSGAKDIEMKISQTDYDVKLLSATASAASDDTTSSFSSSSSTSLTLLLRFQRLLFSKLYSLDSGGKGLVSNPGWNHLLIDSPVWSADWVLDIWSWMNELKLDLMWRCLSLIT